MTRKNLVDIFSGPISVHAVDLCSVPPPLDSRRIRHDATLAKCSIDFEPAYLNSTPAILHSPSSFAPFLRPSLPFVLCTQL